MTTSGSIFAGFASHDEPACPRCGARLVLACGSLVSDCQDPACLTAAFRDRYEARDCQVDEVKSLVLGLNFMSARGGGRIVRYIVVSRTNYLYLNGDVEYKHDIGRWPRTCKLEGFSQGPDMTCVLGPNMLFRDPAFYCGMSPVVVPPDGGDDDRLMLGVLVDAVPMAAGLRPAAARLAGPSGPGCAPWGPLPAWMGPLP